jgi:hypothetical protein
VPSSSRPFDTERVSERLTPVNQPLRRLDSLSSLTLNPRASSPLFQTHFNTTKSSDLSSSTRAVSEYAHPAGMHTQIEWPALHRQILFREFSFSFSCLRRHNSGITEKAGFTRRSGDTARSPLYVSSLLLLTLYLHQCSGRWKGIRYQRRICRVTWSSYEPPGHSINPRE